MNEMSPGFLVGYILEGIAAIALIVLIIRIVLARNIKAKRVRSAWETLLAASPVLYREKRLKSEKLFTRLEDLEKNTKEHCKRVSEIVAIMAGYATDDLAKFYASEMYRTEEGKSKLLAHVADGGLYHDIGKEMIPSDVLYKTSGLTDDERDLVQMHPINSKKLINLYKSDFSSPEQLSIVLDMAEYHHERSDGKGYPNKVSGSNIPFVAKLCTVADVFDALVSKRCYKGGCDLEQAKQKLLELVGVAYDPRAVECLFLGFEKISKLYERRNSGKRGKV